MSLYFFFLLPPHQLSVKPSSPQLRGKKWVFPVPLFLAFASGGDETGAKGIGGIWVFQEAIISFFFSPIICQYMPIVFVLATANTAKSFDHGIPRIRQLLSPYGMYGPAGVSTFFAKLLWIPVVSWGHIRLDSSVRGHILCSWKLNVSVAFFKMQGCPFYI